MKCILNGLGRENCGKISNFAVLLWSVHVEIHYKTDSIDYTDSIQYLALD